MENETPAPAQPAPAAASELPPASAAPGDGDAVGDQQPNVDTQTPSDTPAEKPEHRKAAFRFSEMSKQNRELGEKLAEERGRRMALEEAMRNGFMPKQAAEPTPAPPADLPPDPADRTKYPAGEFDGAFIRDQARFEARQEFRALQESEARARTEAEAAAAARATQEAGVRLFTETCAKADELGLSGARAVLSSVEMDVADDIMAADNAAYVAEWLDMNPQSLAAIRAMDARQRALTIGKIDAQISFNLSRQPAQANAPSASPQPAQNAQAAAPSPNPAPSPTPAPMAPGRGAVPFNPETASIAEYRQRLARGGGG